MKLDHRKYTVMAVLAALILLLMAGTVLAQPVITTFQPDIKVGDEKQAGDMVTWTATSPTGVSYAFYIMKRGEEGGTDQMVHLQWYSDVNSVSYTFPDVGTYYARVFVLDKDNKLTWTNTLPHWDVEVVEGGTSVLSGLNFDTQPGGTDLKVPDSLVYTVSAIGGEGSFEYAFYLYRTAPGGGDSERVHIKWYSGDDTLTYPTTEPGFYQAQAFVRDATKTVVDKSAVATVGEGESSILRIKSIIGNRDDGTITWDVTAAGGEAPYQYAFYVYKGDARVHMQWYGDATSDSTASLTYAPTENGTYELQAFVRDKTGKTVLERGGQVPFEGGVLETLNLSSVELQGDPPHNVGAPQTWKATASGGEGSLEYAFYVYEAGVRVHIQWYSAENTIVFTPTQGDDTEYYVQAFVRDDAGTTKIKESDPVKFTGDTIEPFRITDVALNCDLGDLDKEWVWTVVLPDKHDGGDTISYCYYIYKGESRVEIKWYEEGQDTCAYRPTEVGSYSVQAFARDENLKTVNKKSVPQETRLYYFDFRFDGITGPGVKNNGNVYEMGYLWHNSEQYDYLTTRGYSNQTSFTKPDVGTQPIDSNSNRTYWRAENGTLLLGTMTVGMEDPLGGEESPTITGKGTGFVWKSIAEDGYTIYRFAGLRPQLLERAEFWKYMIAPNLPYGEIEFKNIHSTDLLPGGEPDQEARFNMEFMLHTSSASGEPYPQRVGISISKSGEIRVLDTKGGKGDFDNVAGNFYMPLLKDEAGDPIDATELFDFNNEDWNKLRIQAKANGQVEMILNGHVVYTTPMGYFHLVSPARGAVTIEVVQAMQGSEGFAWGHEAGEGDEPIWDNEQVGNAWVELKNYSFGIMKKADEATDPMPTN